jgi:hypothetical protein
MPRWNEVETLAGASTSLTLPIFKARNAEQRAVLDRGPTHRELAPTEETGIFFIQKARGFTTRNTLSARNNDADTDSAG